MSEALEKEQAWAAARAARVQMAAQGRAIRELFGPLTARYDLHNRLFSLGLDMGWRRELVRGVRLGPTGRVLDLAAGTLDVSLLVRRQLPQAQVLALDLCAPMLHRGMRRKLAPGDADRIAPAVADARCLPLPDASVDAVTIAFGIRNMVPREAALAEIRRVLTPGGRLHILELAPVRLPLFGSLYHWHLERVMPALAGVFSGKGEAFRYLGATIRNFPAPEVFARELDAAGLRPVAWQPLAAGIANIHRAEK